ncbi:hypothetical protein ONZ45_g15376 [Pleurotus djamor]|nr:hypothetical protein ONZ45_g15376 [Pleurotus djamor]
MPFEHLSSTPHSRTASEELTARLFRKYSRQNPYSTLEHEDPLPRQPTIWKGKDKLVDDERGQQAVGERRRGTKRKRYTKLDRRDEGPGGPDGIVLPMEMLGGGVFDAVYTIPVRVGASQQNLSVQIDSGSSDLWFASSSCSTQSCSQTNGNLYDPSSSTPTGQNFDIPYLRGRAAGPIVWDRLELGGYSVENQALAAADNVVDEPLAPQFVGIMGLALPLNSIIAETIPPGTSNAPDGQSYPPNLFSITPREVAPSFRFLSLSLSRPGSAYPPSLLGIGRHPAAIRELHTNNDTNQAMDLSKVRYSTLVSERSGVLFWKTDVRGITVWVDGVAKDIPLSRGVSGSPWPTAVVDSGVPLILTTSSIANAIYGAIGVNPASDGQYYVPCSTPLNITMILDDRPPLALHPLDLTGLPPRDNSARFCIGLIQAADNFLLPSASNPTTSSIGDMILGVPFMRSVYTVMTYDPPDPSGIIPNATSSTASQMAIRPRLGLLSLVDSRVAMEEFERVRIAHQPLTTGSPSGGTSNQAPGGSGSGGISVGIAVLIGLICFFALCFVLFGIRWYFFRRKWRATEGRDGDEGGDGMMKRSDAIQLARAGGMELTPIGAGARGSIATLTRGDTHSLTDEELKNLRHTAYVKKERIDSEYTMSSGRTLGVGDAGSDVVSFPPDEFGAVKTDGAGGEPSPAAHDTTFTFANRSNASLSSPTGRLPEAQASATWGTDTEDNDGTAVMGAIVGGGVVQQSRSMSTRDRDRHRRSSSAAYSTSRSPPRR